MRSELPRIGFLIAPSGSTSPITEEYTQVLHPQHTASQSSGTRIILLLGFRRRDRLNKVDIGFRVGKLFDAPDLQAPVIAGNDVVGED